MLGRQAAWLNEGLGPGRAVQRADLLAVGVAQVGQVELAARAVGHPRLRDFVVEGVPMRKCDQVLRNVAGSAGVSKSAVSRRFVDASAAQLAAPNERPLTDAALLAIYIDGIIVDGTHTWAALGVYEQGR